MKSIIGKLLVLLTVFVSSCGMAPDVVTSSEIPPDFVPSGDMSPEFYFNSWEANKADGAEGMSAVLEDNSCLIFGMYEGSVYHELGHCTDVWRGFPSQSEAFQNAVDDYCLTADMESTLGWQVCTDTYSEAYAILYTWDILYTIPQEFEEFYAR